MKTRIPNHKDHLKLAAGFHTLQRQFLDFAHTIWAAFPKAHRISLQVDKLNKQMAELKHRLDGEYHRVTSDAEFNQSGHIYYNDRGGPLSAALTKWIYGLDYNDPKFREPESGELVIGIYRNGNELSPVLLWADPKVDLFYDVGQRQHVKPPKYYLRIDQQNQAAAALGLKQPTPEVRN